MGKSSKEYHRQYRAANRDKLIQYKRVWNKNNRARTNAREAVRRVTRQDLFRNNDLKCKFGISLAQYNEMMRIQENCCAICEKHQKDQPRRMSVDHNHATGKVRALLCNHCNTGLGYFRDNINLLTRAILYLYEHNRNS